MDTKQRQAMGLVPGPSRDFIGYGPQPPRILWPNDTTLAINLVLVYEEGSEYSLPDGDQRNEGWGEYNVQIAPDIRDLGTETHFEYGSRAGIWRIARLIDQSGIPVTISACARALERNPHVVDWIKASGHDVLGHGLRWIELFTLSREEEKAQLLAAVQLYKRLMGERPLGWNSRSFPSVNTRDLIVEEGGFEYYSDPCNDDIPYFEATKAGRLLIVPYSKTYNDSRFLIAPGYGNPRDFTVDVCSAIDYLAEETRDHGGRMMTIAVHARWTGQANRVSGLRDIIEHVRKHKRAAFMRRADIAAHFRKNYGHLPTLPRTTP